MQYFYNYEVPEYTEIIEIFYASHMKLLEVYAYLLSHSSSCAFTSLLKNEAGPEDGASFAQLKSASGNLTVNFLQRPSHLLKGLTYPVLVFHQSQPQIVVPLDTKTCARC